MTVLCKRCVDNETGSLEEISDNSLDIWYHFHSKHPDIWYPFRSTYDNTDAKQALRAYLKIE